MAWLETVVCSSHKKVDARFLRILNAHQELKRRQDGCVMAWAAKSVDGQPLFLVQSLYKSRKYMKSIAKLVADKLDPEHGPLESFMSGPPLVGIFEVDESNSLNSSNRAKIRDTSCRIMVVIRHRFDSRKTFGCLKSNRQGAVPRFLITQL